MLIKSYSGDTYEIPRYQDGESETYRLAVSVLEECKVNNDYSKVYDLALATMLLFEEGWTGWKPSR